MKKIAYVLPLLVLLFACGQDDTVVYNPLNDTDDRSQCDFEAPIYDEFTGDGLRDLLVACFRPVNEFTYTQARNILYSDVDVYGGEVGTIYSNYSVAVIPDASQLESFIDAATNAGINCEHVFPQSQGAGEEPARADMYHIYPERAEVNSARSFYPFANINDNDVTNWYFEDQNQSTTPMNPEDWARGNNTAWEPSDDKKGDVARSVFYFVLIYRNVANLDYFEGMRETLLAWHAQDPVDFQEQGRADRVFARQGNYNPFILDEGLAERVFGE